ncbi:hypothetical protein ACFLXL_02820 [Chloroflexota bacterium]
MIKKNEQFDKMAGTISPELDDGSSYIGYQDALDLVYEHVHPVGIEELPLDTCDSRIATEDVLALINNPSSDVSLKDGYAIRSEDIAVASAERSIRLSVIGSVFAGSQFSGSVAHGTAVKICSGSPIPEGAGAVVAEEFCQELGSEVLVRADADTGRNILRAGEEVKVGEVVIDKGKALLPGYLGLAAVGGDKSGKGISPSTGSNYCHR